MISLLDKEMQDYSSHASALRSVMEFDNSIDPYLHPELEFIFICFTNRCGSNLVAEALGSTGFLNVGRECWNAEEVARAYRAKIVRSFNEYFHGISLNDARNNRFVSKLSLENLVVLYRAGLFSTGAIKTRFLFVKRRDALDQAISLALALETSAWTSHAQPTLRNSDVTYDKNKIQFCLDVIKRNNNAFEVFFARNRIQPFLVHYEDFLKDPWIATKQIGTYAGIDDLGFDIEGITLRKQADETNLVWRERFLTESRSRGHESLPV